MIELPKLYHWDVSQMLRDAGVLDTLDSITKGYPVLPSVPSLDFAADALANRVNPLFKLDLPPSIATDLAATVGSMDVLREVSIAPFMESIETARSQIADIATAASGVEAHLDTIRRSSIFFDESFQGFITSLKDRLDEQLLEAHWIDPVLASKVTVFYEVLESATSVEEVEEGLVKLARAPQVHEHILRLAEHLPSKVKSLRVEGLEQGLSAHGRDDYICSCMVFVAWLDGIMGDIHVEKNNLDWDSPTDRGTSMPKRVEWMTGAPLLAELQEDLGLPYPYDPSRPRYRLTDLRNFLQHGDPRAEYTEKQSAKLMFLVLTLLNWYASSDQGEN